MRYLAYTEIMGNSTESPESRKLRGGIVAGGKVNSLLKGQNEDGGFGKNPYSKWSGSHWRLVSLANLGVPPDNGSALRMAENVLSWIYGHAQRGIFPVKNGRPRMHASVYGNAVGACSYFGLAGDRRVGSIVDTILENQWPDGGWNCDPKREAEHSSFHESLATLWGLVMYYRETGKGEVWESIERVCELFLNHHIFLSHRTGRIIRTEFLKLRYPVYWHYNFLESMRVLCLAGKGRDNRMDGALNLLEDKSGSDGKWKVEGAYWRIPSAYNTGRGSLEVVDWGRTGPNEMITLHALFVLRAAGRL